MDIVIRGLSKAFGPKAVLRGLNLTFPQGSRTVLMGPSGCGKTTLLRVLMGLERADSGAVSGLEGRRLAAVFQEDRLCRDFSALANLRMACGRRLDAGHMLAHLREVGLEGAAGQPVHQLSGGMRRRVAIVRAVLAGREVLLLDEPLKGLDAGMRRQVADYLLAHTAGQTVVMVTHDPDEVALMDARLAELRPVL